MGIFLWDTREGLNVGWRKGRKKIRKKFGSEDYFEGIGSNSGNCLAKKLNKSIKKILLYRNLLYLRIVKQLKKNKMKNLFIYFGLLGMTTFGMWMSLTWDIPVDNQIGVFFLSCMCLGLFFMVLFEDIKNYFKSKKLKPQRF